MKFKCQICDQRMGCWWLFQKPFFKNTEDEVWCIECGKRRTRRMVLTGAGFLLTIILLLAWLGVLAK